VILNRESFLDQMKHCYYDGIDTELEQGSRGRRTWSQRRRGGSCGGGDGAVEADVWA